MTMRIKEALARANRKGKKITQKAIAMKVYEDAASEKCATICLSRLANGKAENISEKLVKRLCDALDCDANYLFDIEPKNDALQWTELNIKEPNIDCNVIAYMGRMVFLRYDKRTGLFLYPSGTIASKEFIKYWAILPEQPNI